MIIYLVQPAPNARQTTVGGQKPPP